MDYKSLEKYLVDTIFGGGFGGTSGAKYFWAESERERRAALRLLALT